MSLRQHTARINNENLIGRQKKLNAPKAVTIKRPVLGELENNTLHVSTILKKATSKNVNLKKHASKEDEDEQLGNQLILKIDDKDRGDIFLVSEYVHDIFQYLRKHEEKFIIRKGYLASHTSTPRMRSVLVNWIVEVHESFKMTLETLHLSVAILDRYLQLNHKVGKHNLQLVGITSILVAAKLEEMYLPPVNDFAEISDNYFNCNDIKKMEKDVLKRLNFNLGRPLSLQFLRRYNKIGNVSPEHHYLAKYLLEIFLLQYELCHINPSLQAAAACCLSLSILNELSDPRIAWTKTLVYCSSYKYVDIKSTVISLAYFLNKMESSKYLAIKEKYARSSNRKISTNLKLKGSLMRKLVEQYNIKNSE